MKFIHTADWHLGKTLKGASLTDDQAFILEEFFKIVDDEKPQAILLAGDIYDRGVPPGDAINLFDEVISKILERKIFLLAISGNHDSATRLNFGSNIFKKSGFFMNAKISVNPEPIILQDEFGEVYFSSIPFFEPNEIQSKILEENSDVRLTYDSANKIYIDESRKKIPVGKRSVAIAHVFLTGGVKSDSERVFVGGTSDVSAKYFSEYNYTALGHLHKPQKITAENIRYSGSPLKYSFDEATHKKSVTLVELDGEGKILTKQIPLTPRRDVVVLKNTFEELMNLPKSQDYIHAELTDKLHVPNAMDRLRQNFPNVLSINFVELAKEIGDIPNVREFKEDASIIEHFAYFFEQQTNEKFDKDYRETAEKFFAELERENNE